MNTMIEYVAYGFAILMLIAVPLALIGGALASRSSAATSDTGDTSAIEVGNYTHEVTSRGLGNRRPLPGSATFDHKRL